MSTRRFVAYFLAVSAGSTVAFAPTLMGQPAPQDAAAKQSGALLTATDVGLEALSPEMIRLLQASRRPGGRLPASKTAQAALVK